MVLTKLNRPQLFNCLSRVMLVRLISLLKHAGDRWFILTGGEPFYCAGGDIMQVFHLNRDSHIMFALAY